MNRSIGAFALLAAALALADAASAENAALLPKIAVTYDDGSTIEGVLRDGGFDGPVTERYPDGSRVYYTLANGLGEGIVRTTFADGSRLERRFVHGEPAATASYLSPAGQWIAGTFTTSRPDPKAWRMPGYPDLSRRLNETGDVTLSFVVGETGRIFRLKLRRSSGSERLDNAALNAARRWRYLPATVRDRPVPESKDVTVTFKLT